MNTDATDLTFEEAFRLLQETVTRLEQGGLSLQESLDLYEQGVRLTALCASFLDQAELRISDVESALAEALTAGRANGDHGEPGWDWEDE